MSMCLVACTVKDGLVSDEKFVRIAIYGGGTAEVAVPSDLVENDKVRAFVIGQEDQRTLIEFPRESSTGRWREWVDSNLVYV
jgi:hypothetical protein